MVMAVALVEGRLGERIFMASNPVIYPLKGTTEISGPNNSSMT